MNLEEAKEYLKKQDPLLARIIDNTPPFKLQKSGNYFSDLVESIISQQLSLKAADSIFRRFVALFSDKKITPENVLALDIAAIRSAGVSYQKILYIQDLAQKTLESDILFEQFEIMTDEEIIEELTKIKGIGRWTAEMFLMFSMGRPDVFSYGDLGLRRAIQTLYGFDHEPTFDEAKKIAERWKPFRTIACCYLWRSRKL